MLVSGYSWILVLLVLSFCQHISMSCRAANTELGNKGRLVVVCTGGFRDELRADFKLIGRAGIKYRLRDEVSTGGVYVEKLSFISKAILGDFKLFSGDGLLFGDAIRFYYASHNSVTRYGPLKAIPALSTWNTQRGIFISMRASDFFICTAAFKKLGYYAYHISPLVSLISISVKKPNTTAGFGALLPWGAEVSSKTELPVFFFNASSLRYPVFISGEVVAIHSRIFFSLSAHTKTKVSFMIRLFKGSSGHSAGDWLEVSRSRGLKQGGMMEVWMRKTFLRPSLILISSITSKENYAQKRSLAEACISGAKRGGINWKLSLIVQGKSRWTYSKIYIKSMEKEESTRESIMRLNLQARRGAFAHILRASFFLDENVRDINGISITLGLKLQKGQIDFALRVNSYTGDPRTLVIFRPGIGSFENLSFVHGRNTDVSSRLKINLLPGLEIVTYYGKPWLEEGRIYVGMKIRR